MSEMQIDKFSMALAFDYQEEVNYALVQSKVDICNWCIVENNSGADLTNLQLVISGEFVETYRSILFHLESGQRIRIQDITVQVNAGRILSLTEKISSCLELRIMRGEETLKDQCFPIAFMPYNQWHGVNCYPQLLASFITPNHPCIAQIVKRASTHLLSLCGSPDMSGYFGGGKETVLHQLQAIYQALCEGGLSYTLHPPSYEEDGQRIRLASEVMANKLGNCMDLTLLMAACLEYIGINTLLILEREHIYLGVWLVPDSHLRSVDDDVTFLMKKTAEGVKEIVVLESTSFAKNEYVPFDSAVSTAFNALHASGNFQFFLDVYRCRLEGFRPLPQLVKHDERWVVSEEEVSPSVIPLPPATGDYPECADHSKPSRQLLWERKLLDFTMRNALLNVKMASSIQLMSIDLKDVAQRMLEHSKGLRIDEVPAIFEQEGDEQLIYDSNQLSMDLIDLVKNDIKSDRLHSYHNEKRTLEILKNLRRSARTMMEENGANSLYMSLGLMQWVDDAGVSHLAPILLLPVEFVYKNQIYHVKWRGEETLLNVTLFEYLKQTYEIEFDGLQDAISSDNTFNLQQIFTILRQGLVRKPRWNVLEECLVGIFSFSKFVMWNDIHTQGDRMMQSPLVKNLVENESLHGQLDPQKELDETVKPSDICAPLPYDSSQLTAILESAKGSSFILQGPPGTGKSQTITNMITNALYHGKRVLFVAEKLAALSVVQTRLEKLGLGAFCLELHSNKATKRHLLQQLQSIVEVLDQGGETNQHLHAADQLFAQRKELMRHVDTLHRIHSPETFSIYDSIMHYCRCNEEGMLELTDSPHPAITPQNLAEYEYYIDRLAAVIRLIGQPSRHPLLGLMTCEQTMSRRAELITSLTECLQAIPQLKASVEEAARLTATVAPVSLGNIHMQLCALKQLHRRREEMRQYGYSLLQVADARRLKGLLEGLRQGNPIARCFKKLALLHEVKRRGSNVSWGNVESFVEAWIQLDQMPLHRQIAPDAALWRIIPAYDAFMDSLHKLCTLLTVEHREQLSISELEERLNRWSQHLHLLKDWQQWCLIKQDLIQKNMGEIVTLLETEEQSLPRLKKRYLARYFYEEANRLIASHPEANLFNGMLFDEKVNRYKELARRYQDISRDELFRRLMAQARSAHTNPQWSGQSVILHKAIASNGRGLSIRRLFEQAPDLLAHFCPCMLMSPMSVAQFLEVNKDMFDLVIFDEASQIPTNEAVGAIARGKNIVIVGDTKQMPPTTFFVNNKTADDEFAVDDLESILDDCQTLKMPSLLLSWHYRSKHESLISFSNNEYYKNQLHTFPAIHDQERRVLFVPVKGNYQKGSSRNNRNEAIAIVDEVERRLRDEQLRKLSIGIISFNVQQQYLIEDLLEARMEKNRQLKSWAEESNEPIFIKNLENVQGDERDVILFSIGYSPDKQGRIPMNFGPLNQVGGERRLNVAVTRSRYEMMVFSSLHASDIDLRRTNAKGVEGLHRFLDYAEHGTLIENAYAHVEAVTDKIITQQIAQRLAELGLSVKTFVGKSQSKVHIAIEDPHAPGKYLLGILLDDKIYHAIPTMSDRELVQPSMLQSLGWKLKRVWTQDWFERPNHVIENILAEIQAV